MKAFILAAGYATRMYPLTRDRAKPLLEVGGAPILTHLVERISPLRDLSEIVVIGNHRFAGEFQAWQRSLRCPVPVRVLDDGSMDDDDKLGAIGDLAFALERVPIGDEAWMVAAGDNLIAFDLAAIQQFFLSNDATTLTLRTVKPGSGPSPYNEVTLNDQGRVTRLREKPADPQTNLAAIALYFFKPEVAELLAAYLEQGGNPDAPGHFVSWLVDRTPVMGTSLEGEWFDIGSLDTYALARARFGDNV